MSLRDPGLTRLAEAILIPPFPGPSAPRWILAALGRGLAGVTLFGDHVGIPGVRRIHEPGGAGFATGILEASAGRSLVVVVRDSHRNPATRSLVTELLTAWPDLVVVEMGLPLWRPPGGTGHLVTYGASRASARAAAERLGLL